jgi:hypothetical protein
MANNSKKSTYDAPSDPWFIYIYIYIYICIYHVYAFWTHMGHNSFTYKKIYGRYKVVIHRCSKKCTTTCIQRSLIFMSTSNSYPTVSSNWKTHNVQHTEAQMITSYTTYLNLDSYDLNRGKVVLEKVMEINVCTKSMWISIINS